MDLESFARDLRPEETVLLLGAGASVPSGGKTGLGLAQFLCDKLSQGEVESDDLAEACSLLEARYGRQALVQTLSSHLKSLSPDGSLISLVGLPWARAYTTNYDQLVEKACRQLGRRVEAIRTNLDFRSLDSGQFELLKIHGCITRDKAFGHADSMLLTEQDYAEYAKYREALFAKLVFDLHTKDVLILGQSLKDRHLRQLVDEVAARAKEQGTSNRIRVLTYASDPARIRLLEERNLRAASGSLAQLAEALRARIELAGERAEAGTPADESLRVPGVLLNRTVEVSAAAGREPNVERMFNGGSGTYADIAHGYTFTRAFEQEALDYFKNEKIQYLTITGSAGVGKTTAARRLMSELSRLGAGAFEHVDEFPLNWEAWLEVARTAKAREMAVYLLVDEAYKHLTGINRLAQAMADEENSSLRVILCAHTSSWEQRSKSGLLKRFGREERLTRLLDPEIDSLVSLIRSRDEIRTLLVPEVAILTRDAQVHLVRSKATADMFVALRYCFPGSSLDEIILKEFSDLAEDVQEVYKVASLLEATYAHASRQIVLEVLDLSWTDVPLVIDRAKGVLEQRLVDRKDGVYVWRTRHPVIAQVIARYKYSDQDELYFILRKIVNALNAAMLLDRYVIPNLCDGDYAIGRLVDTSRQVELLERLCERSSNRIPWHRLIAIWLEQDLFKAERTLRQAVATVGMDSPIARYEIRLKLLRARELQALKTDDYITLILDAESLAREALRRWRDNKYPYLSFAEVGEAFFYATGSRRILDEAVEAMSEAYEWILDDQLLRWRQRFESIGA